MSQFKNIQSGFAISNHTFLNRLTTGLQEKLLDIDSDLEVVPTGKKVSGNTIQFTLIGQVTLENVDDKDRVDDKVRQLMDSLKNESNLLSLLSRG